MRVCAIQKVLASRKELVDYDRQQQEAAQSAAVPLSTSSTPSTPTLSPRASELFVAASVAADAKTGSTRPREKSVHCLVLSPFASNCLVRVHVVVLVYWHRTVCNLSLGQLHSGQQTGFKCSSINA